MTFNASHIYAHLLEWQRGCMFIQDEQRHSPDASKNVRTELVLTYRWIKRKLMCLANKGTEISSTTLCMNSSLCLYVRLKRKDVGGVQMYSTMIFFSHYWPKLQILKTRSHVLLRHPIIVMGILRACWSWTNRHICACSSGTNEYILTWL